jgi:hypothetical protein
MQADGAESKETEDRTSGEYLSRRLFHKDSFLPAMINVTIPSFCSTLGVLVWVSPALISYSIWITASFLWFDLFFLCFWFRCTSFFIKRQDIYIYEHVPGGLLFFPWLERQRRNNKLSCNIQVTAFASSTITPGEGSILTGAANIYWELEETHREEPETMWIWVMLHKSYLSPHPTSLLAMWPWAGDLSLLWLHFIIWTWSWWYCSYFIRLLWGWREIVF